MIYLQLVDYNVQEVVANGPHVPTSIVDGKTVEKSSKDCEEIKRKTVNRCKAVHILYCCLNANKFNRISICTSAKEVWNTLEVTHESTNQVKESNINLLVNKYELFKVSEIKTILKCL